MLSWWITALEAPAQWEYTGNFYWGAEVCTTGCSRLSRTQERVVKNKLSPNPTWQEEITDAYTLIVECDRQERENRTDWVALGVRSLSSHHIWKPSHLPRKQKWRTAFLDVSPSLLQSIRDAPCPSQDPNSDRLPLSWAVRQSCHSPVTTIPSIGDFSLH